MIEGEGNFGEEPWWKKLFVFLEGRSERYFCIQKCILEHLFQKNTFILRI